MNHPGAPVWLYRLAALTAGATFLLIVAGALVVGHEAGLAVPDWPLSFGTWMPAMEGGVFYEHGHRMVAGAVGLLTAILGIGLWRFEARRWVRRLGLIALLAVMAQALLGGLTVLYLLPTSVVIGHASLAQTFFCLALTLAVVTSPAWDPEIEPLPSEVFPAFRHLCAGLTAAVFLQLILGASLRHNALGVIPHLLGAGTVAVAAGWIIVRAATRLTAQPTLWNLSLAAGVLCVLQVGLGIGSYFLRLAAHSESSVIWVTTAHVAVGALLLGLSWTLTLLACRRSRISGKAFSFVDSPQKSLA